MDEDTPGVSTQPRQPVPPTTPSAKDPTTASNTSAAPAAASSASSASVPPVVPSKRRRGYGVVTPNACTECRKKRSKCDGQKPCGRCKQHHATCIYEVPVRQSKDTLRSEIEQLRRQQSKHTKVLDALVRSPAWEEVLTRLRKGESIDSICEWLEGTLPSGGGAMPPPGRLGSGSVEVVSVPGFAGYGSVPGQVSHAAPHDADLQSSRGRQFSFQSMESGSHPSSVSWHVEGVGGQESRVDLWVESQGRYSVGPEPHPAEDILFGEIGEMQVPPGAWTNITNDSGLIRHLLALYFCWEYPTFASLSKEHFVKDFLEGRHRFCSPMLVNALLALGCRFSTKPNTRANPNDPRTSGDHFFQECVRLYDAEDNHHKLTTIQALGIMSIREASCGRDSESWYYAGQSIRIAMEMGLHHIPEGDEHDDEAQVQAATFWGAFALDHAWSLATGTLPQYSRFAQLPPKPPIISDIESSLWIPYTDDDDIPVQSCKQPSNVRSVYKCFCELSELVHQSLYVMHSPDRPLTSRALLHTYTQYLNWYDKIPEVLRLGHNFTPAVLFAHMYYHFAILLMFRPLIKLRIIGSSIVPRDVCLQAADAISGLLRSYSRLYTLRRTPSFVPYFVLTSSIMHLAIAATTPDSSTDTHTSRHCGHSSSDPHHPDQKPLRERIMEYLARGIADLTEMIPCHNFAEQALNILRYLAKRWNINVSVILPKQEPGYQQLGFTRPVTTSLNFFATDFSERDFNCEWGAETTVTAAATADVENRHRQGSGDLKDEIEKQEEKLIAAVADAVAAENPLFWPFPMQGRPILPSGRELEEAGFALL